MSAARQIARAGAFDLVVMIASLGGLEAASTVLAGLPETFPAPILVLQHGRRSARATEREVLAALLQRSTRLPVKTATGGGSLVTPGVAVLPHGSTATVERTDIPAQGYGLRLADADAKGGGDALLAAAASIAGQSLIAVILTGMLCDGALGVRAVKRGGGRVLAEDPQTARAGAMPTAAIATGCVDFVLPANRIAFALVALTMAPGGADLLTVPTPAWASLH